MKTFPTSAVWCFGILFISASLITTGSSEVQVVGPADPVVALAGDDIILPCSLEPNVSAEDMAVEWTGLYLRTRNVHLYLDGRDSNEDQFPSYRGRTSMFHEELKNGNVSLKLTRVTLSDAGSYRCFIPTLTSQVKETTVQLFVEQRERLEEQENECRKLLEEQVKGFKLIRDMKRDAKFVNRNKVHLSQNVTMVTIAFYLICSERYSEIHVARTRQDQMRLFYEALDSGGKKVKSDFYRILLDLEPDLVIDLGAIFVDDHKDQLIQRVTMVKSILHELFYEQLYCNTRIHQMTSQEQMRQLYKALEEADDPRKVKLDFYRILLDLEPDLVKYLEKRKLLEERDELLNLPGHLEVRRPSGSSASSNWMEDNDLYELNKNLTGQLGGLQGELNKVKMEKDGLQGELIELNEKLRKAEETIQSLSTSPGGQQETQTPSQKSERIEGMEMKSLPGPGRKSVPEMKPLLAAGPQNDDLDEMERGGRVTTDNNSML
ncbi:uncharacterized protein LOC109882060 isoform X7 [Oncorhynchus kisutch]|uniref:Butyrophilin subfamily 1 member A1-like n=1 Tax=Oncorhynchus kisutch TaxID=8019 RepID=A0A8C7FFD2_ONCKI|nr:uncharacterized protein LOC109882060 isoform X7 [Oncorhynchus kisutch]